MYRFKICKILAAVAIGVLVAPGLVRADTWRGTAPFCDGHCLGGEEQIGLSDYGDGGYCVTGHKALCRNSSQGCKPTESRATCYGVVMVCENGFQESLNQVWHTCTTYACGMCIGAGRQGSHPLGHGGGNAGFQSDLCKSGYVWREAAKGDHVCVTPETRTQAASDNAAWRSRRTPMYRVTGSDTCLSGFVWREAVPTDHVCVLPATRAAANEDNQRAEERLAPQPNVPAVDTCKTGFVWREAIKDDHVCVPPGTRDQAADDNARANERKQPGGGNAGPDTCKPGFVWREVVPQDHICVTPETRAAVVEDTSKARERLGL